MGNNYLGMQYQSVILDNNYIVSRQWSTVSAVANSAWYNLPSTTGALFIVFSTLLLVFGIVEQQPGLSCLIYNILYKNLANYYELNAVSSITTFQ